MLSKHNLSNIIKSYSPLDINMSISISTNATDLLSVDYPADPEDIAKTILLIVTCCGITGCVLTLTVLRRKMMSTSTNCYLTALAMADLMFLLILPIQHLVQKLLDDELSMIEDVSNVTDDILFTATHYLAILQETFYLASIWTTVLLSAERYVVTCHPLRAEKFCIIRRPRTVMILLFLSAFVVHLPVFWDIQFERIPYANSWTVTSVIVYNQALYVCIVSGFFASVLPFLALLGLNVRLILEIHKSSKYLRYGADTNSSNQVIMSREQRKQTILLISIVVVFLLCLSPYIICNAIMAFSNFRLTHETTSLAFLRFRSFTIILMVLKSSCNFVLYCWLSKVFWFTFKNIFCTYRCLRKQRGQQSHYPSNQQLTNTQTCEKPC